ncbi:MAG: phage major capsid protein, partial [Novosphingobium sp.]
MSRLKDLRQRQEQIVAQARERLDQIGAATDEARAAELETQHDAAMADYDRLEQQITREEHLARLEQRAEDARARLRPIPGDSQARSQDDGEAVEYRTAFAKAICGPLEDLSPEERAVLAKGRAEFRAQTAGTTTA